jgi:aminopeptidase N
MQFHPPLTLFPFVHIYGPDGFPVDERAGSMHFPRMLKRERLFILSVALVAMAVLHAAAELPFKFETTPGKLPKDVVPRHYLIHLKPDLETFTTKGDIEVDLEVLKPVRQITLNALGLEIGQASILAPKKMTLQPTVNEAEQTVTFALPESIAPGKYKLSVEFSGHIRDQAQGLFYVRYAAPGGKKLMLGTQMEPTDARRMFPCWDEPSFRASFEPVVIVPEKHVSVSNMPIKSEKPLGGGLKEVHFGATPPMASYLVVFVSGELEELKDSQDGVEIRILTTEGKREQGRYALASAKKILAYYNQYFGVKFPLPKLDEIAVPGGFGGAMENWGGIVYNERLLLYDPLKSSLETKQTVFSVMAHEMAHQWFGDLVTTAWWDNLWLNEGFASWMAAKATDHFNPEWQGLLNAVGAKTGVMSDDSRSSTHPILQAVKNESQANDAFDQITYRKGQAFLRMLENYLGEGTFQKGLQIYMKDHRFSNTTTADLWAALEKASGKPVSAFSAGWTEQPGVPVVSVRAECVDGKQMVHLEQERFTVQDPKAQPLRWKIPVSLTVVADPKSRRVELLEGKSSVAIFPNCEGVVVANAGGAGYYRVSYAPALMEKLKGCITTLPPEDRLNLLGDTWAMVEAGRAPATSYLDLASALRDEKITAIWDDILGNLGYIDRLESGQPGRPGFRQFALQLVRPQLVRLGWEPKAGEPPTDTLLRNRVIELLGDLGDKDVIATARSKFQKFLTAPDSLPATVRPPIVRIVGHYADRAAYDQIHALGRSAKGTEERQLYYRAMAGAYDPELAALTLPISLTEEIVPQEALALVPGVAVSGQQPELAWKFGQEHLKELLDRAEEFRRNNYVPSIMSGFNDAARADELETFVREKVSPKGATKAREAAEAIRLKSALKERELPGIDRWAASHERPTP